jgi:excisionase family DNA binding protein
MERKEIQSASMAANTWLGTPAASTYLGVSQRTLYRLIDQGDVAAYQMGRVIRVRKEDLDAYLEQARIEPGALRHLYPDPEPPDQAGLMEAP